ncbi:hypothetical protein A3C89_03510 [Candidatus Kaiserbacteria bacterium RIFCSPHIGHO2_02_FULL_50_50]|uniref:DUF5673 domain-containing protein n=1 Tax=Candidatus Kaiserbacteria bacterium RIFCSPHIGHO2_02_FULL_50_50 TaxID=1798492 RepID=A0A1F6DC82_9BACT|nr:MAG: hypothetical protein A3C89_03510 [Candidatus Kaiserbacteria bacterium RIFCSPHIGHO2_02_FULL_50_50]OGG88528.1 MAG: hypothetical protein A3G62_03400 [Candidatus Kaiserbacteria bacterium RIFCSPLOWO2_12_FULL_50_10]
MDGRFARIEWDALPHFPHERGDDWYWVLGIVGVSSAIAAFVLGNVLFGILIILGILVIVIYTTLDTHEPITYVISQAGVTVNDVTFPYAKLTSFFIDREHRHGPHLLIRKPDGMNELLIIPIPEEHLDDIDETLSYYLPEEHLEEPLSNRILELLGI